MQKLLLSVLGMWLWEILEPTRYRIDVGSHHQRMSADDSNGLQNEPHRREHLVLDTYLSVSLLIAHLRTSLPCLPLYTLNSAWGQFKYEQSAISNQAVVCWCSDCKPVVEEWGVLDCIALEALSSKFQHRCFRSSTYSNTQFDSVNHHFLIDRSWVKAMLRQYGQPSTAA